MPSRGAARRRHRHARRAGVALGQWAALSQSIRVSSALLLDLDGALGDTRPLWRDWLEPRATGSQDLPATCLPTGAPRRSRSTGAQRATGARSWSGYAEDLGVHLPPTGSGGERSAPGPGRSRVRLGTSPTRPPSSRASRCRARSDATRRGDRGRGRRLDRLRDRLRSDAARSSTHMRQARPPLRRLRRMGSEYLRFPTASSMHSTGRLDRIADRLEQIDARLEASEGLLQVSRELRALNYASTPSHTRRLGQSPQGRRRAGRARSRAGIHRVDSCTQLPPVAASSVGCAAATATGGRSYAHGPTSRSGRLELFQQAGTTEWILPLGPRLTGGAIS